MSCSRLLSIDAWRSLLQAVSLPATWSPARSNVQAHSVLRALCSLATDQAPLQSRSAATCTPPVAPAWRDAHNFSQVAHNAREARPEATSACICMNIGAGGLAKVTLLRHTRDVCTAAMPLMQSRPLSSGAAADRDTPAADEASAVEVTAASTHPTVLSQLEPLLTLLAVVVVVVVSTLTGCMCINITCNNFVNSVRANRIVGHCTAGRKRHRRC